MGSRDEIEVYSNEEKNMHQHHQEKHHEKKYSELAKQVSQLRKFDWFDSGNPQIKVPPVKLLTPAAFWFLICSEYFPRSFSLCGDPQTAFTELLAKLDRQNVNQVIRVNDKVFSLQENNQEAIEVEKSNVQLVATQVRQTIQKLIEEKPAVGKNNPSSRQNIELREEYSFEDDLYIMSMRHELIELYSTHITAPGSLTISTSACCGDSPSQVCCSEQTTGDEDSSTSIAQQGNEKEIVEHCESRNKQEENNTENILKAMKEQDIDDVIALMQIKLADHETVQKARIPALMERMVTDLVSERFIYKSSDIDFEDILADIQQSNAAEKEYLTFLEIQQYSEEKQLVATNQAVNQEKLKSKSAHQLATSPADKDKEEDLACQICNDGDYTDDDLIVFCSVKIKIKRRTSVEQSRDGYTRNEPDKQEEQHNLMEDRQLFLTNFFIQKCNISVHQRCYGIPKIPNDDWICDLCQGFGPNGKYLRCGLCTQRGGAMKPSRLPISSSLFQNSNPAFYEFQKNCKPQGNSQKKQKYGKIEEEVQPVSTDEAKAETQPADAQVPYYDFHTLVKTPFTEEELKEEPNPHFVWCHVTCALWTPECFFDDKNYYTNVKGLENIDKNRFKIECSICKEKKSGACVQCMNPKCVEGFHPECARRAGVFMEVRNSEKLVYSICCERHTPLKLRRQLEHKEKKYKEEIIKFCKAIERTRESHGVKANTEKQIFGQKHGSIQMKHIKKTKGGMITSGELEKKKANMISPKALQMQIAKNAELQKKQDLEFQKLLAIKMIEYLDTTSTAIPQNPNTENGEKVEKKVEAAAQQVTKIQRWQNKVFMKKDDLFWNSFSFCNEQGISLYKRYKHIQRDLTRKQEFKALYFKTLSALKNIRIVTKEERLKEKERIIKQKLFAQKHGNSNAQVFSIFMKSQDKMKKKSAMMYQQKIISKPKYADKVTTKESQSAVKQAARNAIEQKPAELAPVLELSPIIKEKPEVIDAPIIPHNYEPVDENSEEIYCVCRRKYQEGDQMMACEKCEEWFHLDCIGFCGTIDQAEQIEFVCKFCDAKEEDEKIRQARKAEFGSLFELYDEPNYETFRDRIRQRNDLQRIQLEDIQKEFMLEQDRLAKAHIEKLRMEEQKELDNILKDNAIFEEDNFKTNDDGLWRPSNACKAKERENSEIKKKKKKQHQLQHDSVEKNSKDFAKKRSAKEIVFLYDQIEAYHSSPDSGEIEFISTASTLKKQVKRSDNEGVKEIQVQLAFSINPKESYVFVEEQLVNLNLGLVSEKDSEIVEEGILIQNSIQKTQSNLSSINYNNINQLVEDNSLQATPSKVVEIELTTSASMLKNVDQHKPKQRTLKDFFNSK